MEFVVQRAVGEDAQAIAEVVIVGTRDAYAGLLSDAYISGLSAHTLASNYLRGIGRGDDYWVARSAHRVIGMARATSPREDEPPRALELTMIYVEAASRGTGVAQELLERTIGNQPCLLWVGAQNLRAQAFYRRNGFRADGTEQAVPALENLLGLRMVR